MNIAFIGDTKSVCGPANVNKDYQSVIGDRVVFLKNKTFLSRLLELVNVTTESDALIISSLNITNDFAIRLAKKKNKPVIYFMVGCYDAETKINKLRYSRYFGNNEQRMLKNADKIVTVSESYMNWAKKYFPKYADKFSYVCLGIKWDKYSFSMKNVANRDPYLITVMGGGRPQKNNLTICKAVQLLNEKYGKPYRLIILGRDSTDTPEIKKMKYVDNIGQVAPVRAAQILRQSSLFIQDSIFESFGLGALEALANGCNLLVSKDSGVLSVLNPDYDTDVIQDCFDIDEIAGKIMKLEESGNNQRLISSIDKEQSTVEYSANKLLSIAESLV